MMAPLHRAALLRGRRLLPTMSQVALGMLATTIALTEWLHLNPCPLCIFQRILPWGSAREGGS